MADPYGFRPLAGHSSHQRDLPPRRHDHSPPRPQHIAAPILQRPYPPSLPPESSPHIHFRPIHPSHNEFKRAYYWVDTFVRGGVPSTALPGGEDVDGHQIYVGRAYYQGDWIPAKVIPGRNVAYIAYGGKEYAVDRYQVLCEQFFDWVHCHQDHIPENAVEGGRTNEGEILYIGRVHHQGSQTVGKVHPSYKSCFIPFGGEEIGYKDYEILVLRH